MCSMFRAIPYAVNILTESGVETVVSVVILYKFVFSIILHTHCAIWYSFDQRAFWSIHMNVILVQCCGKIDYIPMLPGVIFIRLCNLVLI